MKNCDQWREAISSHSDGHEGDVSRTELDDHIAQCNDCATYSEFVYRLKRRGLTEATPIADVSQQVVKTVQLKEGRGLWTTSRAVLAACAFEIIFFSVRDLFSASHDARHLGAFSSAIGIAFLMVALRPTRARMMMPVTIILGLTLALGAVFDVVGGQVPLLTEARHIPEIISVVMIWMLAKPVRNADPISATPSRGWVPRIVSQLHEEDQRGSA